MYHIAITFDDNYLQHACVMLQSLKDHVYVNVTIHCICDDLSLENKVLLNRHFKKSLIQLNFVEFDTNLLPQLPIKATDHVSPAAFFRIWLPYLLPNVDQVLFLDCDLVINGDIDPLLNLDLKNTPLAAVPDLMSTEKKTKLGINAAAEYFNSGVMVMNLDYFRQHNLTQQLANFITGYPELCEFWDQDAFNAVLKGNFYQLDTSYNVQRWHFHSSYSHSYIHAVNNPVIVHYAGGGNCKPWFYQNNHPLKNLYYKYLRQTPFRSYCSPDIPRNWRILRKIKSVYYRYSGVN